MYRFYRGHRNSTIFAALLLLLLVVLAGQNTFSGFFSNVFSRYFNVRPACILMRSAYDRDDHQSLIARAASQRAQPLQVDLLVGPYPTTPDGLLTLTIVLTNTTIGTVPFVYSGGVPFNNPVPDGFGIVTGTQPLPPVSSTTGFLPESNIRLLVPLQSCVEVVNLTVAQLQQFGISAGTIVRAYYRNSNAGALQSDASAIYPDHGLWVGMAISRDQAIPVQQAVAQ
jgi:hypothetical protein